MKNEKIKFIIFISICVLFLASLSANIFFIRQSQRTRREADNLRYELDAARNSYTRITEGIGQLSELNRENTTTISECIELINQIRKQAEALQEIIDSSEYNFSISNNN